MSLATATVLPLSEISQHQGAPERKLSHLFRGMKSISLDQCNALASMQDRIDTKYLVNYQQIKSFIDSLASGYNALEIESRRQFRYASCYYDDPQSLMVILRRRWRVVCSVLPGVVH